MSVYKLHATSSNADGLASLDIQNDGKIKAVNLIVDADLNADAEGILAELSFMSSSTFTTNDVRGSIAMHGSRAGILTSGGLNGYANQYFGDLDIPVEAGERIYIHSSHSGTVTGRITAFLYVDDGVGERPKRRRR